MQSNGGVAGGVAIRRAPALTTLSGPAAGVVGAREVAAACGIKDIITVDIGGTSADICLIKNGQIALTQSGHVGDWPLPMPMVDMVTIGAEWRRLNRQGGRRHADRGPAECRRRSGPAAYGRGGTQATVTDAHVVLGHLPARLLGGLMALDAEAAARAVGSNVARPLGLGREEAARGMLAILDNNMMGALRIVSVERGHDPRDFTLVPFGGAGPCTAAPSPSFWASAACWCRPRPACSAPTGFWPLTSKPISAAPCRAPARSTSMRRARSMPSCRSRLRTGSPRSRWRRPTAGEVRVALMRYHGQGGEVTVDWVSDAAGVEAAFAAAHESLYGFKLDSPIELVTLRIEATGRMPAPLRPVLRVRRWRQAARPARRSFRLGNDRGAAATIALRSAPATASRARPSSPSSTPRRWSGRLVCRGPSFGRDPVVLHGAGVISCLPDRGPTGPLQSVARRSRSRSRMRRAGGGP